MHYCRHRMGHSGESDSTHARAQFAPVVGRRIRERSRCPGHRWAVGVRAGRLILERRGARPTARDGSLRCAVRASNRTSADRRVRRQRAHSWRVELQRYIRRRSCSPYRRRIWCRGPGPRPCARSVSLEFLRINIETLNFC